jgi:O-antigen/teichoic acid export membrane protein
LGSGVLLAASNVYAGLSIFAVLSIVFNSVDLRTFGAVSLMLTSVAIFQVLFNTQSWQGLLNSGVPLCTGVLRRCLFIDVSTAATGSLLLVLGHLVHQHFRPTDVAMPTELLWMAVNVALIPPGALVGVIRQEGRFAHQAMVDILATTLKMGMALIFVRSTPSLYALALTLLLPELLRWCGYLVLTAPRLLQSDNTSSTNFREKASLSQPTIKAIYGFSFWGMLNEIIHLPTAHIDKLLVGALLGLEHMAIWDILKRCATAVVQLTTVINQMLFPHYVRIRGQLSAGELTRQCLRQCLMLSMLLLLIYGTATLFLPLWLPLAFHIDTTTWSLTYLQRVFGMFALVMCFVLGATPVHSLFLSLRHSSQSFGISLAGNLLFFATIAALLPWLGLFGASLAILVSDAFIILTKFWLLRSTVMITRAGPKS